MPLSGVCQVQGARLIKDVDRSVPWWANRQCLSGDDNDLIEVINTPELPVPNVEMSCKVIQRH